MNSVPSQTFIRLALQIIAVTQFSLVDAQNVENISSGALPIVDAVAESERGVLRSDDSVKSMAKFFDLDSNPRFPEYIGAIICLIYFLNFLLGSWLNKRIANEWVKICHPAFAQSFAQAGPGAEDAYVSYGKFPMHRDSSNCYTYYATGRRGCESLSLTMQLKNRQDIFSSALGAFFNSVSETITIEVAMKADEMEPINLAIVQKSDLIDSMNVLKLKDIATAQNINGLPSSLACISNFSEICSALLTTQVKETLASTHELIEVIHVTDQNDITVLGHNTIPKKIMRFVFLLPSNPTQNMEKLLPLMNLVLTFIDAASTLKISSAAKAAAEKRKNDAIMLKLKKDHETRMQRMRELKAEKIKKEKEEYETLTDAQKQKREEKDRKKALKTINSGTKLRKA